MILAVGALLAVLAVANWRPRGLPEALVAGALAGLLIATDVLSWPDAVAEAGQLGPTLGFLAAVLLLAELSDHAGVFRAAGKLLMRVARGRPQSLLRAVFVVATSTTILLSLDATVVLLTPVVYLAASRQRLTPKPHVYACGHLANSGSLLLPVSNLTNLLAFAASGLSFGRFAMLMALPQAVAVALEYMILRRFFVSDLTRRASAVQTPPQEAPTYALFVLALTLGGFAVTSLQGLSPAWAAGAGALLLAAQVRPTARSLLAAVNPAFLVFVLALALIVRAVTSHGLGPAIDSQAPHGDSFLALLSIAGAAAVLANVLNNLPAVLLLLPAVAGQGAGPVLALIIGVNVGPNLTYVGSLATLLWRRVLRAQGDELALGEFTRLGLLTTPAVLLGAVASLWLSLTVFGGSP